MPFVQVDLAELGGTEPHKGDFRAHLQFRAEAEKKVNIYGPSRVTQEQAQNDLEQICKAAEKAETREEGLQLMRTEAEKLKEQMQKDKEDKNTADGFSGGSTDCQGKGGDNAAKVLDNKADSVKKCSGFLS